MAVPISIYAPGAEPASHWLIVLSQELIQLRGFRRGGDEFGIMAPVIDRDASQLRQPDYDKE